MKGTPTQNHRIAKTACGMSSSSPCMKIMEMGWAKMANRIAAAVLQTSAWQAMPFAACSISIRSDSL